MGLLVRRRQEPRWLLIYHAIWWLVFAPFVLALGAFYLVTGNSGGRVIGGCLLAAAAAGLFLSLRRAMKARDLSDLDLED